MPVDEKAQMYDPEKAFWQNHEQLIENNKKFNNYEKIIYQYNIRII